MGTPRALITVERNRDPFEAAVSRQSVTHMKRFAR